MYQLASERLEPLNLTGSFGIPIFPRVIGEYDSRKQDALRDDSRTELPTGTVVFAGYSSLLSEPEGLRFGSLRRTNDGFFLKVSYLFRL